MEKWIKPDQALIGLYEEIASQLAGIEKSKMFGCPCAFVNGNMFFGVFQDQLFLRMGEKEKQELNATFPVEPFSPMGRMMKGYVLIPLALRSDPARLLNLVQGNLHPCTCAPAKDQEEITGCNPSSLKSKYEYIKERFVYI